MKVQLTLVCVVLLACKYGGSDDDPLMGLEPGSAAEPDALGGLMGDDVMSSNDASVAPSPAKPPTTSGSADAGKPPTTGSVDAGVATGKPTTPANPSTPANACGPATAIATCDPVRNTGCPPLTQCDIETSATVATGRCVFYQATPGVPCSSSFVNVTCDAQNTCVGGECRKMCYCDSDCPPGNCCNDTSGPGPSGVFKLCRPC